MTLLDDNPLVVGCNYHTTWQENKSMRFVLIGLKGSRARLATRTTCKDFWTDVKDLVFIKSDYNKNKAARLLAKKQPETKGTR